MLQHLVIDAGQWANDHPLRVCAAALLFAVWQGIRPELVSFSRDASAAGFAVLRRWLRMPPRGEPAKSLATDRHPLR
jgi:hypothetical protein